MGSNKPRGIQAARKLRVKRRLNRYVTIFSYPSKLDKTLVRPPAFSHPHF